MKYSNTLISIEELFRNNTRMLQGRIGAMSKEEALLKKDEVLASINLSRIIFMEPTILFKGRQQTEPRFNPDTLEKSTSTEYVYDVTYQYSGNPILFGYRPNNFGEVGQIATPKGNQVLIEIITLCDNQDIVIELANEKMSATRNLLSQLDTEISDWYVVVANSREF